MKEQKGKKISTHFELQKIQNNVPKQLSKVLGIYFDTQHARFVYMRLIIDDQIKIVSAKQV